MAGPPSEVPAGPSFEGSVVADIGGDIGAAVLSTPEALAGLEIEIRRVGHDWDGTHTAVRPRHLHDRVVWAAFFGALRAGCYEVRVRGNGSRTLTLEVAGGRATESTW